MVAQVLWVDEIARGRVVRDPTPQVCLRLAAVDRLEPLVYRVHDLQVGSQAELVQDLNDVPTDLLPATGVRGSSATQTVTFSPMAPASSIRACARSRSGADHAPLSGSRVYGQNGS